MTIALASHLHTNVGMPQDDLTYNLDGKTGTGKSKWACRVKTLQPYVNSRHRALCSNHYQPAKEGIPADGQFSGAAAYLKFCLKKEGLKT